MVVVALFIGLGVVALIGALFRDDSPQKSAQPPVTVAPTTTGASSTTEAPATTAKPTTTAKPVPSETILRNAVAEPLGESNRDVRRLPQFEAKEGEYTVLTWRINESLTEGLTKDSAHHDGVEILRAIKGVPEHDRYKGVALKGTYPLVDKYGNSKEQIVIRANYDRSTLEKINFDGIDFKTIFDIADSGSTHPAFQY